MVPDLASGTMRERGRRARRHPLPLGAAQKCNSTNLVDDLEHVTLPSTRAIDGGTEDRQHERLDDDERFRRGDPARLRSGFAAPGSFKLRRARAAAAWKISIEYCFKPIEFWSITAILDYVRKLFAHGLGQDPAQGGNDWCFVVL